MDSVTDPAIIAIIPARGGSKRLPRKNIAPFHGRPIIAWTIDAAIAADCFDAVIVSTEDAEIAGIAAEYGARVEARPPTLAGDRATVTEVCLDLLDREEAAGRPYDILCCLYATAPLRNADDIRAVVEPVTNGTSNFAMAVTDFDKAPYRALRADAHGRLTPMWPDLVELNDIDVGRLVVNNGSAYAARVSEFRRYRTFTGPKPAAHFMERLRSPDIDTAEDLEFARWCAERLGFGSSGGAA